MKKKTIIRAILIFLMAAFAVSCSMPDGPDATKRPGRHDEVVLLDIGVEKDPKLPLILNFKVLNRLPSAALYRWEMRVGGRTLEAVGTGARVQLSPLEFGRTYLLEVKAYSSGGDLLGRGGYELCRHTALFMISGYASRNGNFRATAVLDAPNNTIPYDQKYEWSVTDGSGEPVSFTTLREGIIEFPGTTPGEIRVSVSAELGGDRYSASSEISRAEEGIMGSDVFVSNQARWIPENTVKTNYSPWFRYYNDSFESEAEYDEYGYSWKTDGKPAPGPETRERFVGVDLTEEEMQGRHIQTVLLSCGIYRKDDPEKKIISTAFKYVYYLPWMDMTVVSGDDGSSLRAGIPIPLPNYSYQIELSSEEDDDSVRFTVDSASPEIVIPDFAAFLEEQGWSGTYFRIRGTGREPETPATKMTGKEYWFSWIDGRIVFGKKEKGISLTGTLVPSQEGDL